MSRIDDLLSQLTLDEKVAMLSGSDNWQTVPVERLGIPKLKMTDGPNGARGNGVSGAKSASFPVGSALGATWNVALMEEVGAALGVEAKDKGAQVLLGPTINLHRHPLGGRHFECMSEDPYLTGALTVGYVRGLQSEKVGACLKHYVANDTEFDRHMVSSNVDETPLRELYLKPFEMGVKQAGAWTVMGAYNRINGTYACSHTELVKDVLKGEWGFEGFVVSDWGACLQTVENATGGLDLEMPGPARTWGHKLVDAVKAGAVAESEIDDKVRRILWVMEQTGRLDDTGDKPETGSDRPATRELTRRAAREAMVLLKNNGVLPFDADTIKTLAVIGPNAERGQVQGGGSSAVFTHAQIHPLDGFTARLGGNAVRHARGCLTHKYLPALDPACLEEGVFHARIWSGADQSGPADKTKNTTDSVLRFYDGFAPVGPDGELSAVITARYTAATAGAHAFGLMSAGLARLYVNDELFIDNWDSQTPGESFYSFGSTEQVASLDLAAGETLDLRVEFLKTKYHIVSAVQLGCLPPQQADLMDEAVTAAREADAVVLMLGTNPDWESEGHDRKSLDLPGPQAELLEAVVAADPNTAIIVNAGAPVSMDWLDHAPAVLWTWFPGQEFGGALAELVMGDHSPSGRLPTSFPRKLEDTPAFGHYPGADHEMDYGEGLNIGYRYYDRADAPDPLFPFGFGLGYGETEWSDLAVGDSGAEAPSVPVSLKVANRGSRALNEVVQIYIAPLDAPQDRPVQELKAFAKVHLAPGASETVSLRLEADAFARWDKVAKRFTVAPGRYEVRASRNAATPVLTRTVTLK